jgi:hypothetical protein
VQSDIVLNLCYFITSDSVTVASLQVAITTVLKAYPACRVWLIFQNPCRHVSNQKWDEIKGHFPGLRTLSASEETIQYTNTTNKRTTWATKLYHEILVRDPSDTRYASSRPSFQRRSTVPTRPAVSDDDIPF